MTRKFCDSCGATITEEAPETSFDLGVCISNPEPGRTDFKFAAKLDLGDWLFNATDRHFCHACIRNGLLAAVDSKFGRGKNQP